MRNNGVRAAGTLVAASLALGLTLAACDDSSTGLDGSGTAKVSILLTDAPGDIAEAWVNIGGIYLQGPMDMSGGGTGGVMAGPGGGMGGPADADGRVWLREDPTGWIDLMTLSGEWMSLVNAATVPAGTYAQLRFVVLEAVLVTDAGKVHATSDADLDALNAVRGGDPLVADGLLHCPSCGRSGLKVNYQGDLVVLADETIVAADFDVSQSFGHETGMASRWVMHPVIHASTMDQTGSVSGAVALAEGVQLPTSCGSNAVSLTQFVPLAINGNAESFSGTVADDGSYAITPLPAGSYSLFWEPEIEFNDGSELEFQATIATDPPSSPPVVSVAAGGTAVADYTITDVDCNPGL